MKPMKKYVFILLFVSISMALSAQTVLRGTVVDKSNNVPLPFATVAVMSADSTVVAGSVTIDNGEYRVDIPVRGQYLLSVCGAFVV